MVSTFLLTSPGRPLLPFLESDQSQAGTALTKPKAGLRPSPGHMQLVSSSTGTTGIDEPNT